MNARDFLPMSRQEMDRLGWDELDVLLVTGDAYVDHPSFGSALLGRWLAAHGYRVGIVAQPRWETPFDVAALGRPRLFAGVTAGALDSMLAHYTAFRKKRSDDAYTPGGLAGARPNRATLVYTSLVKQAFPGLPVVIGGIEASLRRATHYDFWTDAVRRSILLDSKADLLVYGMGERAILKIAERLKQEPSVQALRGVPGTAFAAPKDTGIPDGCECRRLPSHEDILQDPKKLVEAAVLMERHVHHGDVWTCQAVGNRGVVFAPPATPLDSAELDALYELRFTRRAHPHYDKPIPALEMVQFSVTAHRGCAGGCSFCSLALHQGRRIQSRSCDGILEEVRRLTEHPDWKGSITDIGGPSANMWGATCVADPAKCRRASCLFPTPCNHFRDAQRDYIRMLDRASRTQGVKHVRVASGVRHDLAQREPSFIHALAARYTGGQLKIAPEHASDAVLRLMRKPEFKRFAAFCETFMRESRDAGKQQFIVPYLMSAFPGCTDDDMKVLACWLKQQGWKPQQVQCLMPTPGTVASAMYHAGVDPEGHPIYVAKSDADRLRQHHLLLGSEPERPAAPHAKPKKRGPGRNPSPKRRDR